MDWVLADEVEDMFYRAYLYIVNIDTFAIYEGLKRVQPADFREVCWLQERGFRDVALNKVQLNTGTQVARNGVDVMNIEVFGESSIIEGLAVTTHFKFTIWGCAGTQGIIDNRTDKIWTKNFEPHEIAFGSDWFFALRSSAVTRLRIFFKETKIEMFRVFKKEPY